MSSNIDICEVTNLSPYQPMIIIGSYEFTNSSTYQPMITICSGVIVTVHSTECLNFKEFCLLYNECFSENLEILTEYNIKRLNNFLCLPYVLKNKIKIKIKIISNRSKEYCIYKYILEQKDIKIERKKLKEKNDFKY